MDDSKRNTNKIRMNLLHIKKTKIVLQHTINKMYKIQFNSIFSSFFCIFLCIFRQFLVQIQ